MQKADGKYEPLKAHKKALLGLDLAMSLGLCELYMWPYSSYLRWKLKMAHRRKIAELEKHCSLDIDVEMDKMTAQLKENMKNIDTLKRTNGDIT